MDNDEAKDRDSPREESSNLSTKLWSLWEARKDNRWFVSVVLVASVGLSMFDMISDCLVVKRWWNKPGFHLYAEIALGIFCVSQVFSFFSFFFLPYLLCLALIEIYQGTPPSRQLDITARGENESGANISNLKVLEFVFESCPQLFLQAYVVTYEYFRDGAQVEPLLQASFTLSVLAIATGIANEWLANEGFVGYCLGTFFFTAMIVTRFAVFAGFFVEFGAFASLAVVFVLWIRSCIALWASLLDIVAEYWLDLLEQCFDKVFGVFAVAIAPLGSRIFKASELDGYNPRLLYIAPAEYDVATVDNVLHSPLGQGNYSLHFLENIVMAIILLLVPSRSKRVDVDLGFVVLFVLIPMAIGNLLYLQLIRKVAPGDQTARRDVESKEQHDEEA